MSASKCASVVKRRFASLGRVLCLAALVMGNVGVVSRASPALHAGKRPVNLPAVPPKYSFLIWGDTRSGGTVFQAAVAKAVQLQPEFVLQSGDLVTQGASSDAWNRFANTLQPLHAAGIAFYPTRGRHDLGPYFAQLVPADADHSYYYAFTRHGSRFLVLDSMDPEEFTPGSAQRVWLIGELQAARQTSVNTFVLLSGSPFSVGPGGPSSTAAVRVLHPLFVKYRPRAVFCGQDALYYRTTRNGVTYFVTGGGGAPSALPDNKRLAVPGDVYANVHHLLRCDVDGNHVTVTAIALDGDAPPPAKSAKSSAKSMGPTVSTVGQGGHEKSQALPSPAAGALFDTLTLGPQ